jgi:hypothetical protein
MTRYIYALLSAVALSCTPHVQTPISGDVEACPSACVVLAVVSCPEAQPSPGGVLCPDWCTDYHAAGYMRPWAACVAGARDAADVRACGVRCAK